MDTLPSSGSLEERPPRTHIYLHPDGKYWIVHSSVISELEDSKVGEIPLDLASGDFPPLKKGGTLPLSVDPRELLSFLYGQENMCSMYGNRLESFVPDRALRKPAARESL